MTCRDIHDAIARGETPDDRAHLADCGACRELVAEGAALGRALVGEGTDSREISGMFASIQSAIRRDRGLRAWLRSRPTPLRIALVLGTVVTLTILGGVAGPAAGTTTAWVLEIAVVGAILVVALGAGFRPMHRPPPPSWVEPTLLAAALLAPVGLALAVGQGAAPAVPDGRALYCLAVGVVAALPIALIYWLIDRGGRAGRVVLAGVAIGLGGHLMLQSHCGSTDPGHLLAGHVGVVWVAVAAAGLTRRLRFS